MTKVTLYKRNEKILGFKSEGHADSSPDGVVDLVCCAVSVLTQTTIESLHRTAGLSEDEISFTMDDGYLLLNPNPSYGKSDKIQTIFSVLECGLALLSESYGEYIQVIQEVQ